MIGMTQPLPRLRLDLEFMPSPDPERPGLFIRDSFQFSNTMLVIPPPLIAALACFDGEQTELDLRRELVHATGEIQVGPLEKHLLDSLSQAGFLEDEHFEQLRDGKLREFAESPRRMPSHAGGAYPADQNELRAEWNRYMQTDGNSREHSPDGNLIGIAAPHVSPYGGWESYRDAYRALTPDLRDRTFVILGTSHYGEPDRFGLTRKRFVTPYGETQPALDLIERLAPFGQMEDYCHAVEHSIEFQVVFLQHIYGPDIRILPILCGSFARSLCGGQPPEEDEAVKRFLGALGDLAAAEAGRILWVLGVDMAHIGRRYGDALRAEADRGEMLEVAQRDRARIERIREGDARGFWDLVQHNHDDLKWCGSAPIYTFLKCAPQAKASLHRYQQWNIDPESVVSFAGMSFHSA